MEPRCKSPMIRLGFFLVVLTGDVVRQGVDAFSLVGLRPSTRYGPTNLCRELRLSSTAAEDIEQDVTSKGLLKRDRYIVTNRFAVRKDRQAKFERRWANRKSRLAELQGFRYFHLMRRVKKNDDASDDGYDEGATDEEAQENYVSFTVWERKSDFSEWRKGDAFKEAHGGTSIGAFVSTMVGSAFVLRGPPRPAFYDGLLVESVPPTDIPDTVGGWRAVDADGVRTLPTECFVGMEKFYVSPDNAAAFEQEWASRKSSLAPFDGFVARSLMRRDGQAKGHGMGKKVQGDEPSYVAALIFRDRACFDNWAAEHRKQRSDSGAEEEAQSPKLWTRGPEKVYYQGTLVIATENGA